MLIRNCCKTRFKVIPNNFKLFELNLSYLISLTIISVLMNSCSRKQLCIMKILNNKPNNYYSMLIYGRHIQGHCC